MYIEDKPWGEDGKTPTYEICPCCGVEFGNEDHTNESVRKYREQWLDNGCIWLNIKEKPKEWDMETQMRNILAP